MQGSNGGCTSKTRINPARVSGRTGGQAALWTAGTMLPLSAGEARLRPLWAGSAASDDGQRAVLTTAVRILQVAFSSYPAATRCPRS